MEHSKSLIAARDEHKRLEGNLSQTAKGIEDLKRAKADCVEDAEAFSRACQDLEKAEQERERLTILLCNASDKVLAAEREAKRATLAVHAERLRESQAKMVDHAANLAAAAVEFYGIHLGLTYGIGGVKAEIEALAKLEAELGEQAEGVERRDPDSLARAHYLVRMRELDCDFSPLARTWVIANPPTSDASLLEALRALLGGSVVIDSTYTEAQQIHDLLAGTFGERMTSMQAGKERSEQDRKALERTKKKDAFEREVLSAMREGRDRNSAIAAVMATHKHDQSIVLS